MISSFIPCLREEEMPFGTDILANINNILQTGSHKPKEEGEIQISN